MCYRVSKEQTNGLYTEPEKSSSHPLILQE